MSARATLAPIDTSSERSRSHSLPRRLVVRRIASANPPTAFHERRFASLLRYWPLRPVLLIRVFDCADGRRIDRVHRGSRPRRAHSKLDRAGAVRPRQRTTGCGAALSSPPLLFCSALGANSCSEQDSRRRDLAQGSSSSAGRQSTAAERRAWMNGGCRSASAPHPPLLHNEREESISNQTT